MKKGARVYDKNTGSAGKLITDAEGEGLALAAVATKTPSGAVVVQVLTVTIQALIHLKDVVAIIKELVILVFGTKEDRQIRKAARLARKHEKQIDRLVNLKG